MRSAKLRMVALVLTFAATWSLRPQAALQTPPRSFTVDQILSFPSPENLIASPAGASIAWTFNERGVRNIYAAEAPGFEPRRITPYTEDDGQELTHLAFSPDGKTVVYVRGGDHGSNRPGDGVPPDPSGSPNPPKIQVWSVPATGGAPKLIGEGDAPVVAPDGGRVAFVKDRRIWIAPIDGSKPAQPAFFARGASESPVWSPDGRTLAFVSNRGDHSFIGLFSPDRPIRFIAPSTSRDSLPAWSSDGRKMAFLRQPGNGGAPRPPLARTDLPWMILIADLESANSENRNSFSVVTAVTSGDKPVDPILQNPGGIGLRWAAGDYLLFMSYRDGFPHLYSIQHPGAGGRPMLLTPGAFMVEQLTLTPDRRFVIYNANAGPDPSDIDRRHLFKVPVNAATPTALTTGTGIEWSPAVTADGQTVAFLTSDAQRAPIPALLPLSGGSPRAIGRDRTPSDFPAARLVTPELVSFRAGDGVEAHGQLFKPSGGESRKPAIVYVHGGGPRQMLLGWHYRWEYANDYGANQYLASRGFIVLSVDYRLSVGYGQAFQFADNTGARGAAEYRDILAAGRYLQARTDVDPARIGIWGASLGGYLTALALGRNSDVFAAGVDMHGVHDRLPAVNPELLARAMVGDGITESDLRQTLKVAYESSPISAVATWKSPVLLIHGDDDRTVNFHQTVDLRRRLLDKGVRAEELVLPDDVHDALLWRNWKTSITAMAQFFEQTLQARPVAASPRR
ncbi:MAG: peptidase S9 [Acidobacteria bacterium]|nr:MAG: peptidase S9 [Acidobacteriota bacterium]